MRSLPVLLSLVACGSAETPGPSGTAAASSCPFVEPGWDLVSIQEIQGGGQTSTYAGLDVVCCGVVTARWERGIFIESTADRRRRVRRGSAGIRVELVGARPEAGQTVRVVGRVEERTAHPADRSETVLSEASVETLGPGWLSPPIDALDGFGGDRSLSEWIEQYEGLEGMRVVLERPVLAEGTSETTSLSLIDPRLFSDDDRSAAGGLIGEQGPRPEVFLVDAPARSGELDVGDVLDGPVESVVTYRDGRYRLLSTKPLPSVVRAARPLERVRQPGADVLRVATLNVEWLGVGDDARIERLGRSIVSRLASPDIVILQEVLAEEGTRTLQALTEALMRHGGPSYDGALEVVSEGALRVALLVRRDRVDWVGSRTPADQVDDSAGVRFDPDAHALVPNPGPVSPDAPAFSGSRVPLAAHACVAGKSVVVVGVHFTSRRGDDPLMGLEQPPRSGSAPRRTAQARAVADFAASVVGQGAVVIVGGDFNDTPGSPTLDLFAAAGFDNPAERHPLARRYSYVYRGTSQLLDHLLVDEARAGQAVVEVVHGQADRAAAHRDTDHDAVVLTLPLDGVAPCPEGAVP